MTADLSDRIAALSPKQLQSLADRLASAKRGERGPPAIAGIERPARIPLSHSQESAWLAERLGLAGTAYCLSFPIRLEGALDVDALERTIAEIVRRHESLRTRFESAADGEGYQVVDEPGGFALETVDLTPLDPKTQQEELERRLRAAARTTFDLENGPLFEARLIKLSSQEHVLCWAAHHLIWDGLSLRIFIHELLTTYFPFATGKPSPLRELEVQYADFASWQRRHARAANEERLGYWRKKLAGATVLELPTDRHRSTKVSFDNAQLRVAISKPLTASLQALCRDEGVTLYMLLLAVMQLLLSRWSAQTDVVVGSPVAGRTKETQNVIGFFSSMLPIRVEVDDALSFRELLARVKEAALEAFANTTADLGALQGDRESSRQSLYQVAFALHSFGTPPPDVNGLRLTLPPSQYATIGTELSLHLAQGADQLTGWVEYATDLFDRATIERFVEHYRVLLEAVVAAPGGRASQLPLLSEQERQVVVVQFNDTVVPYPHDKLIHQLFEEQVRRTPTAIAIVDDTREITYRELDGDANRLAHHLIDCGVLPGDFVAVCTERGARMIIAILAILKAGGVYVPLDTRCPRERIEYMLKDANIRTMLTEAEQRGRLPDSGARTIEIDTDWATIRDCDDFAIDIGSLGLTPDSPAYLMYTSGSTGEPKGVMVPHRGVNRLVINNEFVRVEATDCTAFCSNPAFDSATFEVWATLLRGARILIVPQAVLLDAAAFADALQRQRVTILLLTTGLFNQYSVVLGKVFAGLKALYFGGEQSDPNIVRRVCEASPPRELIHLYGPTETTCFATWHRVESVAPDASSVSIGRPLNNTAVYILDRHRQPVPLGWVGEIYVGGDGVARGYMNRPELTAERFLPDPFSGRKNARMYRTGDLGRWLPDGTVEFCGRRDRQVKIRGYRVELTEIEAQLGRHPKVKDAVVLAREDVPGDKRIVAYVCRAVSEPQPALTKPTLEAVGEPGFASAARPREGEAAFVQEWRQLYDSTYGDSAASGPTFVGWKSSYTGLPIPQAQMQEWLHETVKRITDLRPRKLLEVGCGTGLVLEQLAPRCTRYRAIDFSANALRQIGDWIGRRPELAHVELGQATALELDAVPGPYDTVVLNSVVQYFPDVEYLVAVLKRAIEAVSDGGKVFIGDIRHLGLLRAFHSSVQLTKAAGELDVGELKTRIDRALEQDKELVIDPEFFWVLQQHLPRISRVDVQIKRGRYDNELTRYRYDVVLHVGRKSEPAPAEWVEWRSDGDDPLGDLSHLLQRHRFPAIRISDVKNARVAEDLRITRKIESTDDSVEVAEVCRQLSPTPGRGVDPESLCRLAEKHGYRVKASWVREATDGSLDFELIDPERCDFSEVDSLETKAVAAQRDWARYAHEPLLAMRNRAQSLPSELATYLRGKLPEYMVPTAFVLLNEMPLTPNGKLDRSKLPAPEFGALRARAYASPQGAVETALADIWQEVLRIQRVGRDDGFFELGGNSILAIQIAGRANRLGLKLDGRQIIELETIASIAAAGGVGAQVAPAPEEPQAVVGEVMLTPLMRQLVAMTGPEFMHKHILVFRLECAGRLDSATLERVIRQLVVHHDALRIRFRPGAGEPRLWNAAADEVDVREMFEAVDLGALGAEERERAIAGISERLRSPSDVEGIRMLRAVLVDRGPNERQLLLTAVHHVVFDPFTQAILLEDLAQGYEQASRESAGRDLEMRFPAKTSAFKRWTEQLAADGPAIAAQEERYWRERLVADNAVLPAGTGTPEFFGFVRSLDARETGQLRATLKSCDASMEETLLAALAYALECSTGRPRFGVFLTRSGRDAQLGQVDVSRTIGWFSAEFPVVLDAAATRELGAAAVKSIKDQIRSVPNHGLGYGILRYQGAEDRLAACVPPKIGLNYLGDSGGHTESLFNVAGVDVNPFPKERFAERIARLQIVADIDAGCLRLSWACDGQLMSRAAGESLADKALQALRVLIATEGARQ